MENINAIEESHLNKMNRSAKDILLGTYLKEVQAGMGGQSASAVNITGGSIVSQYARFGNSEGSTYFEADGTMVMSGSATVWGDLFFPLLAGKQGQTDKPLFDTAEQGYLFPSADATQVMYISVQFNHDWKLGSTVFPHVHWNQNHSGSPVFKMDYKWFDLGSTIPSSYTTYAMASREYPYTSGSMHQLNYNPSGISGSHISGVSSMMLVKLYRDDNAYSGNAIAYQFDIHRAIDTMGSREEYAK